MTGSDEIFTVVCFQITLTGWTVRQLCQEDERENWQKVIVSIMDDDDVYELRCTKRRSAMFAAMR